MDFKQKIDAIKNRLNKIQKEIFMQEFKLKKVIAKKDNVVYTEEGEDFGNIISFPKNYNDKLELVFSNGKSYKIEVEKLKDLIEDNSLLNKYPFGEYIKELVEEYEGNIRETEYFFPQLLNYKDITDYEFNGFKKIQKADKLH